MGDVFAIIVGGLGMDQTHDIRTALEALDPMGVGVWSPPGLDDWEADIVQAALIRPAKDLVLIGHSFGGHTCVDACQPLAEKGVRVSYLALLDPVSHKAGVSELQFPTGDAAPLAYDYWTCDRGTFGVTPANVVGAVSETVQNSSHNSLPHIPRIIDAIVTKVLKLAEIEDAT